HRPKQYRLNSENRTPALSSYKIFLAGSAFADPAKTDMLQFPLACLVDNIDRSPNFIKDLIQDVRTILIMQLCGGIIGEVLKRYLGSRSYIRKQAIFFIVRGLVFNHKA